MFMPKDHALWDLSGGMSLSVPIKTLRQWETACKMHDPYQSFVLIWYLHRRSDASLVNGAVIVSHPHFHGRMSDVPSRCTVMASRCP